MKIAAVIMMLGMAAGSLNASTVDRVFVRQLWPWSTDIYVEYGLGDVSGSTDLLVEVYDGNTKIDQSVVDAAISGDYMDLKFVNLLLVSMCSSLVDLFS